MSQELGFFKKIFLS